MITNRKRRRRAIAPAGSPVAADRFNLYTSAWEWARRSIEAGYHLEAIALLESLISDRLESRLSFLLGKDVSFRTLGDLIVWAREHETDEILHQAVVQDLDQWRQARNRATHEMVKIEHGIRVSWDQRLKKNKQIAAEALRLLRIIGGRVNELQDKGTGGVRATTG